MKKDLFTVLAFAVVIVLFPSEAWVSGQAGFTLLEPDFIYTYSENARRVVHADHYERYWANKWAEFDERLKREEFVLQTVLVRIAEAKIPISLISLTVTDLSHAKPNNHVVSISSSKGVSKLTFQVATQLTESQRTALENAVVESFAENNVSKSSIDHVVEPDNFVRGLTVSTDFPQFSLGISIGPQMRKIAAVKFRAKLEAYLKILSPVVAAGIEKQIATGKLPFDPKQLASLKTKQSLVAASPKPRNDESHFNPNGPLHDEFGRRFSSRVGMVVVDLLFMTTNAEWNESREIIEKTDDFQRWLDKTVADALIE